MSTGKLLKYVRHSVAGFVVWPKHFDEVHHAHVGKMLAGNRNLDRGHILSAGFIEWTATGLPVCSGRSESLGIASIPDDTNALRAEWGVAVCEAPQIQVVQTAPPPAQQATVHGKVRRLIAEQAAIPVEEVADEKTLVVGLHLDSLDLVELAMAFEDEFGFPADSVYDVLTPENTVADVLDMVTRKVVP